MGLIYLSAARRAVFVSVRVLHSRACSINELSLHSVLCPRV